MLNDLPLLPSRDQFLSSYGWGLLLMLTLQSAKQDISKEKYEKSQARTTSFSAFSAFFFCFLTCCGDSFGSTPMSFAGMTLDSLECFVGSFARPLGSRIKFCSSSGKASNMALRSFFACGWNVRNCESRLRRRNFVPGSSQPASLRPSP